MVGFLDFLSAEKAPQWDLVLQGYILQQTQNRKLGVVLIRAMKLTHARQQGLMYYNFSTCWKEQHGWGPSVQTWKVLADILHKTHNNNLLHLNSFLILRLLHLLACIGHLFLFNFQWPSTECFSLSSLMNTFLPLFLSFYEYRCCTYSCKSH